MFSSGGNQEIGLRLADFEENPELFPWAHSRRLTIHNSNSALGSVQFSIIIPAHNDWNLLEGCLRSLAEQTNRLKFEVIVVDDGSRDPEPESIREWKNRYPLSIARHPNGGIAARNRGMQEASGEILVFTDADCRFHPNCVSILGARIDAFPQHSAFSCSFAPKCSNKN